MSYSFFVSLPSAPSFEEILRDVDTDGLLTHDAPLKVFEGLLGVDDVVPFWREGVSTRPLEMAYEDGEFSIRILTCACAEDHTLALDIVCSVAEQRGVKVRSEEDVEFSPSERDAEYGHSWIYDQVSFGISSLLSIVDGQGVVTLIGPQFDFHVGPNIAAKLRTIDEARRADAMFTMMRAKFYPADDAYHANLMVATLKDGSERHIASFTSGIPQILPNADSLIIIDVDGSPLEVPFEALEQLVGAERITMLDEHSPHVAAIGPDEWTDLVARARTLTPKDRALSPASSSFHVGKLLLFAAAVAVVVFALSKCG